MPKIHSSAVACLFFLAASGTAHAQDLRLDQSAPARQPPVAVAVSRVAGTADWNGQRTRLANAGFVFTAAEVVDAATLLDGDPDKTGRAAGQLALGATIDTHNAWGLPQGGRLQATITNRQGNSLTNDAGLGLLQPAQTAYGRGTIWRLSQFWYEQSFDDGATALKFGRVTHSEDYGATPCGNVMNLTLCGPASSQIVNGYLYNFPVSSWGARLRQRLAPDVHVNLGVIESNPVNLELSQGFYLGTSGATGTIYAGELQWTPKFGVYGDLPGTYKIGGWYDSSDADDIVQDVNGDYQALTGLAFARRGRHSGVHANVQQQLIAPELDGSHGLSVVANFAMADRGTNRLRAKAAVILAYTGAIVGRPRDDLTFGIGASFVNDRVSDAQRAQNEAGLRSGAVQDAEIAVELNYGYRAASWLTIRPGLQYIRHPAGRADRDEVIVAGLKLGFTL